MPIHFAPERWEKVANNARLWWEGKLNRPLIQVYIGGEDPGRPEPKLPRRWFTSHYDFSISAEEIVDRWDYDLSGRKYLGDAFPTILPAFGPGIPAAFLGCEVINTPDTSWFKPPRELEVAELNFQYDPDNVWLRRVKSVYEAAVARWGDRVLLGGTSMSGVVDILSSFRPAERLLLDLYDHPARVEELIWQLHHLWWQYYEELDAILRRGGQRGYTCWTPLFSEKKYHMLQCDFCYMIGPEMFRQFVLPEIAASCRRMGNAAYHLDGPGQIPHLDTLLNIPELKCIQYVPTVQARDATQYPELHRRIRQGRKLIQVFGDYSKLGLGLVDVLAEQLGDARNLAMVAWVDPEDEPAARAFLHKYGVDEE